MNVSDDLKAACLAILAELEREFFAVRTFTELQRSTGLRRSEIEAALAELQSRQLVGKFGKVKGGGSKGYQRIYVPNAKPLDE
jgi:hypothetical protein